MKIRTARKAVAKWRRGEGHYTWRGFGTILRALAKLASYERRRGRPGPVEGRWGAGGRWVS